MDTVKEKKMLLSTDTHRFSFPFFMMMRHSLFNNISFSKTSWSQSYLIYTTNGGHGLNRWTDTSTASSVFIMSTPHEADGGFIWFHGNRNINPKIYIFYKLIQLMEHFGSMWPLVCNYLKIRIVLFFLYMYGGCGSFSICHVPPPCF